MKVRYTLRHPKALKWAMDHPGRGESYSIRELAEVVGKHHSLIGHLLAGERETCDMELAHAISEAVGVGVLVLFAPPASPKQTDPATGPTRTP